MLTETLFNALSVQQCVKNFAEEPKETAHTQTDLFEARPKKREQKKLFTFSANMRTDQRQKRDNRRPRKRYQTVQANGTSRTHKLMPYQHAMELVREWETSQVFDRKRIQEISTRLDLPESKVYKFIWNIKERVRKGLAYV